MSKKFVDSEWLEVSRRSLKKQSDVEIKPGQPGTNSWESLLHYIHMFLFSGFELENSGLAYLRRAFPEFIWQHSNVEYMEEWEVYKLFQSSDYIWQMSWQDCYTVVTASLKGKRSHKPIFCSLDCDDPHYTSFIKMMGGWCFNMTTEIEKLEID